jgi:hypothetical protein
MFREDGNIDNSPASRLPVKQQAADRLSAFREQNPIFRPGILLQIGQMLSAVLQLNQFLRLGRWNSEARQFSHSVLTKEPEQKAFVVGRRQA